MGISDITVVGLLWAIGVLLFVGIALNIAGMGIAAVIIFLKKTIDYLSGK